MSCVFTYVASECKLYSAKWLSVTHAHLEILHAMASRITGWQEEHGPTSFAGIFFGCLQGKCPWGRRAIFGLNTASWKQGWRVISFPGLHSKLTIWHWGCQRLIFVGPKVTKREVRWQSWRSYPEWMWLRTWRRAVEAICQSPQGQAQKHTLLHYHLFRL